MKVLNKKGIVTVSLVLALILALTAFAVFATGRNTEEISDTEWFYLSDFPPMENVKTGFADMDYLSINSGLNASSSLLLIKEGSASALKYTHGMSIHAPGRISYDISCMNATRFTALFGVNAEQGASKGSVGLRIYTDKNADGEYLYCLDSAADAKRLGIGHFPITSSDAAAEIDIMIPSGATRLYFEVTDGGDGIDYDHAVFAEPKLFADYVYLSNMEYTDMSTGWGNAVLDGSVNGSMILNTLYKGDRENGKYSVKTPTYEEGICIHAPSSVTYNIEGMGITRFTAFCGISANSGNYNPTTVFKVLFDGKEAHSITKTRNNVNVSIGENIDISVPSGTKTITLTALATGSNNGNHTCWAYPRLFGDNLNSVSDLSLEIENGGLFIGSAQNVKITAKSFKGFEWTAKSESIELLAESDNVVIDGGKVKAIAPGRAILKVNFKEGQTVIKSKVFELDIFDDDMSWSVESPSSKYSIKVLLANGKAFYTANANGDDFVLLSRLGLITGNTDFSSGLEFASVSEEKEINETYSMISGKFSEYVNHCTERVITFTKGSSRLNITIRAYDDGVAFRYSFTAAGTTRITDEATELSLPRDTYVWYQPNTTGKHPNTHEQKFGYGDIERYPFDITLPFMYKTKSGTSVVVSEADLNGSYCGSVLQSISETRFKFGFPEQQTNSSYSDSTAVIVQKGEFESPWRAFVAGDEKTLFESTLFEDLSDPSVIEDTSWIIPGVTAWSWMSGMRSGMNAYDYQANKDVIKSYIDLAASMGWEYYILDEGWMKRITNSTAQQQGLTGGRDWLPNGGWYTGFYDYTEEIVEYANSKNVGLIAWVHVSQIDNAANDYAQMDKLFSQLHEFGIKGIKADFFNSENQKTIKLYNKIYEKCMKNELLANLHGSNKPTGERRTYPNVINREAIYGEELSSTKAAQMVIQSYVRGLVGPTDFTPYIYPSSGSDTTMAQQLAYSIIYESGMTCFASTIDEYNALPEHIKQYFYAYPSTWKDSVYISGSVGVDMTVAREARDGRWYVGGITTTAKTESFILDFLEENTEYTAYIYTDNGKRNVNFEERSVQKGDVITASLSENGGFAVKITKNDPRLESLNSEECGQLTVTPEGNRMLFKVEAREGFGIRYAIWNGRKIALSESGEVSLMMTGGDCTFEVVYENVSTVKLDMTSGGSVGITQGGKYKELVSSLLSSGGEIEIIASPARGYKIGSIKANGRLLTESADGKYLLELTAPSIEVFVTFEKIK